MNDRKKTKSQLIDELVKTRIKHEGPRESKEKYHILFEHASDAIIITDSKGNFLEVNRKAEDLLGYTRKELVGMNPTQIHPKEELKGVIHSFSRIAAGEIHSHNNTKIVRKDGRLVPVDITGTPIEYEGKTLVQGVFRDITERKKTEETLQQAEARYRSIVENVIEGIFQITPEGRYRMVSPVLVLMYGYSSPEEMIETITDIGRQVFVNPDERKEFLRILHKKGSVKDFQAQLKRKDGSPFWVSINARYVYDEKGNILYHEGTSENITELKKTEEELKKHRDHLGTLVEERTTQLQQEIDKRKAAEERSFALIESIREWVWEVDADFVHTYVSPRVYHILGYKPEEIIGKRPTDVMPPEEIKRAAPLIKKIVSEKKPFLSFPNVCYHKNGHLVSLEINAYPFFDRDGNLLGYRGSGHDVTEKKKVLDALKERDQELTTKSKTLEEVNTALRVMLKQREEDRKDLEEKFVSNIREMILLYVHKIQKGRLDPKHRAYIDIVETNLKEIVSPYLNTIRQFNFTPREIEVTSLIRNGKTTKEIAEIMDVAPSAIDSHRNNIRKKLGLNNKKVNLFSHLLSLR